VVLLPVAGWVLPARIVAPTWSDRSSSSTSSSSWFRRRSGLRG